MIFLSLLEAGAESTNWDKWGHIGDFLAGLGSSLTFLAVLLGGVVGLRRYLRELRLKAAELLLVQLEPEHRKILPTCVTIEFDAPYEALAVVLKKSNEERKDMTEDDQKTIAKVDRCLRFFYTCTVMDSLGVEQDAIVRAYYFYFLLLLKTPREDLHTYIRTGYPRLWQWLSEHEEAMKYFKQTGVWKPSPLRAWWINRKRQRESPPLPKLTRP